MVERRKISLIGAGNIGASLAHMISLEGLADVVLFDIVENMPQGKALDIAQSTATSSYNVSLQGTNSYKDIENSDVIIVTAGIPRKPGMSREDLIATNTQVMQQVGENIKYYSPEAFVIVVTNPLDAMVWVMREVTGLPSSQVVGMAGVLDTSRFSYFLAEPLGVNIQDINSLVLGGHGDSMVPIKSYTTVAGIPLGDLIKLGWITEDKLNEIIDRTKYGGGEIVKLLGSGSAYVAPAASVLKMARSYLKDEKKLMPCSTYLNGEYDVNGLYIGVPIIIGKNGIEKIVEIDLNQEEADKFNQSVKTVEETINKIKL